MSLFRNVMYSDAPILKQQQKFFGYYEDLNKISSPTEEAIRKFQLDKLKLFQKQALKTGKGNKKAKEVNHFLLSNYRNFQNPQDNYTDELGKNVDKIFKNINSLAGSGYMSKGTREQIMTNKELEKKIESKLQLLGKEITQLRNNSDMLVSSKNIDKLDNLIDGMPETLEETLKRLYLIKGDILEEVGTEYFNKRIPVHLKGKVKAFTTGAIGLKGKGQLIQDILVLDIEKIELMKNVEIEFTIDKKPQSMPIKQFLDFIEKYNGESQIVLTNSANEILNSVSLAGIQAKSGFNQLPWNTGSKNTWVNLDVHDTDVNRYVYFLKRIQGLYQEWDIKHKNIKKESPEYTAMANYILGTQLSKVLHLSKMDNQFVLTPNGFMPYVSRILELHEKFGGKKYPFSFKGKIRMDSSEDIITVNRPVTMTGKN